MPPHHTEKGFKNLNPNFEEHGFGSLFRWGTTRWMNKNSIDPEDYPAFPFMENDGKLLRDNKSKLSVTWIGHATTLVQLDGINVLTDPIWSERCSPVSFAGPKRFMKPGLNLDELPPIHLVVLSHNHYDHTDLPTLKALEEKFHPQFLIGLGNQKWLESEGLTKVKEMDWWDQITVSGLQVHFTPTQHFSGRGLNDRNETLWGSYVLKGKKETVYFAGDTAYYDHFREIQSRLGAIKVAILPIGAFEPRWFMSAVHVDPPEAVQAYLDLKAEYMVPMHYSTFVLSDEKLTDPLDRTRAEFQRRTIPKERLKDLKIGETSFF